MHFMTTRSGDVCKYITYFVTFSKHVKHICFRIGLTGISAASRIYFPFRTSGFWYRLAEWLWHVLDVLRQSQLARRNSNIIREQRPRRFATSWHQKTYANFITDFCSFMLNNKLPGWRTRVLSWNNIKVVDEAEKNGDRGSAARCRGTQKK